MNRQQEKRLNDLEGQCGIREEIKPSLILIISQKYETPEEIQAHPEKPRMTKCEAKEEAFKQSGKPGKIEDYLVVCVVGVAVKPSEDALPVYTVRGNYNDLIS
jgi:hypothetical protein